MPCWEDECSGGPQALLDVQRCALVDGVGAGVGVMVFLSCSW